MTAMNAHAQAATFKASITAAVLPTKPSPVASLSRSQLARWAFDQAYAQLKADTDAGLIPADVALLKFNALRAAYYKRREDLKLEAFIASRGLSRIMGRVAA